MRMIWLLPAVAFAASAAGATNLTFAEALSLAEAAPDIAASGLRVDAARASARSATALPDPRLQLGYDAFPVSGPTAGKPSQNDFSAIRVGVEQEVPNDAKRRARGDGAEADIGAAEKTRDVEVRKVRTAAALAWIDLYYAERRLDALKGLEKTLANLHQAASSRVAAGSARPAQALEADQLAAALADRRTDLTAAVIAAKAAMWRWTGSVDIRTQGDAPTQTVDGGVLRATLENLPAVQLYGAKAKQAEAGVSLARADKHPDWSWQAGYQHRDPRFGDLISAGVAIQLPLFTKNRQDPIIAARTLDVDRVRVEREATRRELVAQLDADLAGYVMHHDRLARAQTILLPLAERRASLEVASYSAGTATLGDAQAAQVALGEARLDLLNREADVVRDAIRLNFTYGSDAR